MCGGNLNKTQLWRFSLHGIILLGKLFTYKIIAHFVFLNDPIRQLRYNIANKMTPAAKQQISLREDKAVVWGAALRSRYNEKSTRALFSSRPVSCVTLLLALGDNGSFFHVQHSKTQHALLKYPTENLLVAQYLSPVDKYICF